MLDDGASWSADELLVAVGRTPEHAATWAWTTSA